jgi:hypothetical protein
MNRRLRDEVGSSNPSIAQAADLLRAVELDRPSADRRARVRRRIAESERPQAVRSHPWLLPAAALFALGFGGAAAAGWLNDRPARLPAPAETAGVELGHRPRVTTPPAPQIELPEGADAVPSPEAERQAIGETLESLPARRSALRARVERATSPRPAPSIGAQEHPPASSIQPASTPDPEPGAGFRRDGSRGTRAERREAIEKDAPIDLEPREPRAQEGRALEDGAEKVALAMERLRVKHDAEGALELLAAYRTLHPAGMLAEEALVLSIEAAAQIDEAQARSLAAEYLARFPSGRFRSWAQRTRGVD